MNTSRILTGALLCLSMALVFGGPAKAEPTEQLLSQLPGHDLFNQQGQMDPSRYTVGRVRAMAGDILFIELFEPFTVGDRTITHLHLQGTSGIGKHNNLGYPRPGDDIGLAYIDGSWQIVQRYHPYWLTRLSLREVGEVQRSAIDWGETRIIGLPPLGPSEARVMPEPEPQRPIRGMW